MNNKEDAAAAIGAAHDLQAPARTQKLISHLEIACDAAIRRLPNIRLEPDNEAALLGVQLHVRIIELVDACRMLIRSGHHAAVPILNRTVYEALADQMAIAIDPTHVKRMAAGAVEEARRLPDVLSKGDSAFIRALVAESGAREALKSFKQHERSFDKQNIEGLEIEDKFIAAGIPHDYVMFRMLSGEVHNDGGTLNRHIEVESDGTRRLTLFATPNIERFNMQLVLAAGNLVRSCRVVHGHSDAEFGTLFNAIVNDAPSGAVAWK